MGFETHNKSVSKSLIIDHGSTKIRYGLQRYDVPKVIRRDAAETWPIAKGIISDWELLGEAWMHIYDEQLGINSEDHPIHLTEDSKASKSDREKMAELAFEGFNVPAMFVSKRQVLSLHQCGRTSGILVYCGSQETQILPVFKSYLEDNTIQVSTKCGSDDDKILSKVLKRNLGYELSLDTVIAIKERFGHVATGEKKDLEDLTAAQKQIYKLNSGEIITFDKDELVCSEYMFQSSNLEKSVPDLVASVIKKHGKSTDDKNFLLKNIVVSGGASLLPGFIDRFHLDLQKQFPGSKIRLIAHENRLNGNWLTASFMTSLPSFQNLWMSQKEYNDFGAGAIHRKCF